MWTTRWTRTLSSPAGDTGFDSPSPPSKPVISSWNKLKPQVYEVHNCKPTCTLSVESLGPALFKTVHGWFEQGLNNERVSENSDKVGHHVSIGACGRHRRNHLVPVEPVDKDDPLRVQPVEKRSHVEVLEEMIALGASRIDPRKITPDILLRAMDMHKKVTEGRALDDTFAAISQAMASAGDGEAAPTPADLGEDNEAALRTPMEIAEAAASLDD